MKHPVSLAVRRAQRGSTLVEVMISTTAFVVVLGGIMMGFAMFNRTYTLAKDYNMARLTLSDYVNMDLRRSRDFQPTLMPGVTRGGWLADDWTLPMAIIIPNYNQTGGSPNQPVKVSLTAAELAAAQDDAIARGKLPPASWTVAYGSSTVPRLVTYEQVGQDIIRREGWGTVTRPTSSTISWTWSGGTPPAVRVAQGVIQLKGVYRATTDLTPEDQTELPPDDVIQTFKGNYTIRYVPSIASRQATPFNSIISNNVLLRTQFYGL